jgi:bacteriophage HK97-gp10 putative tail-component
MIEVSTISSDWPSLEDLEEIAEEQVKEIAGDIFRAAVQFSPVWSGEYRASWRVSFNEARTDTTKGRDPATPIRGASFRWPSGFKLGDVVIISNNVEYAERIEYGWSNQAPFGVLNLAVAGLA